MLKYILLIIVVIFIVMNLRGPRKNIQKKSLTEIYNKPTLGMNPDAHQVADALERVLRRAEQALEEGVGEAIQRRLNHDELVEFKRHLIIKVVVHQLAVNSDGYLFTILDEVESRHYDQFCKKFYGAVIPIPAEDEYYNEDERGQALFDFTYFTLFQPTEKSKEIHQDLFFELAFTEELLHDFETLDRDRLYMRYFSRKSANYFDDIQQIQFFIIDRMKKIVVSLRQYAKESGTDIKRYYEHLEKGIQSGVHPATMVTETGLFFSLFHPDYYWQSDQEIAPYIRL